jgi:hypothetical protein
LVFENDCYCASPNIFLEIAAASAAFAASEHFHAFLTMRKFQSKGNLITKFFDYFSTTGCAEMTALEI